MKTTTLLSFPEWVQAAKAHITEIDLPTLQTMQAEHPALVLIDVREQDEQAKGMLPNALPLGRGVLEAQIARVAPTAETPIVLYCASGNRSALAAKSLQEMGYQKVYSLSGGYNAAVQ